MLFQAHPCRERVWADPDMSAILPIKGLVWGGTFWCLFLAVEKKTLARVLGNSYEATKALVCETMFRDKFRRCNTIVYETMFNKKI